LDQKREAYLLKLLEEKQDLAREYRALKESKAFQRVILQTFLGEALEAQIKVFADKKYNGEDIDIRDERALFGRLCLRKFLDNIESDADKAKTHVDTYNKLKETK
jgi:hypothetical protein